MFKRIIITLAFLPIFSFANQVDDIDVVENSLSGFWVGLGSGIVIRDNNNAFKYNKKYGPTGKFEIGYQFTDKLSIFSSYDYSDTLSNNKLHIATLGLKGNVGLTENFSLFANLGFSGYFSGSTTSLYKSDSYGSSVGAGLEYKLSNSFTTKLGYNYFNDIELKNGRDSNLHQIYWGITYKFGQPKDTVLITEYVPEIEYKEVFTVEEITKFISSNYVVTFPLGKSVVSENTASEFYLQEVVQIMKEYPEVTAQLIGRADKTGSFTVNKKISEQRSEFVKNYLIQHGISSDRISLFSVSNLEPLSIDNSEIERSVEIKIK
ncbi:OmpA family protein [Vibrio metschnikovii]